MSAFYDLASLVVVPSGYKAAKIYAQKPLTTDGQLAFTRASTATRVNASGLIEAVASGVPRLDYLNSTCPKLLLEPQRSNLALYSEQFDNAAWGKFDASVSANTVVSPDGSANADTLTTSAVGGKIYRSFTSTAGAYTLSLFVKKGTSSTAFLNFYDGSISQYVCQTIFNLNNGTFTGAIGGSAFITDYGNGFWRIGIIDTLGSSASSEISIGLSTTTTGNAFIYGAQLEAGAYATSYIPTTTASVTRVVDACLKTGISSLIGQTEGTMFVEVDLTHFSSGLANEYLIQLYQDAGARILVFRTAANELNYYFLKGGVAFFSTTSVTANGRHKLAFGYKSGDSAFYIDGVQQHTSSTAFTAFASLTELQIAANFNPTQAEIGDYSYAQALLFKTRLTNAQLAELTSL